MNITHLKYAVEIAKVGSINKASEILMMGQPNLSRAIKDLEASLGITIFDRTAKGMFVTPEGEVFLQYAKKILQQIDEVESIYKKGFPKKQRFSISVPRASYISDAFANFSKRVEKERPSELLYMETNSVQAMNNILHSDYKLGVIRYAENYDKYFKGELEEKGLSYETVVEFRYVLLMHREHPLAQKEKICFEDLRPFTEIAHADPSVPSLPISSVKKEELTDDIKHRIFVFERGAQFDLLCENRETFMRVSPIPERLLSCYDLVQRELSDNKKVYKDVLIYRKDYNLSNLDKLFVEELYNSKNRIFK